MSRRAKRSRETSSMLPRSRKLYKLVDDNWEDFKSVCNRRWEYVSKGLLKGGFDRRDILGSGYFGIVLKTSHKKLVVKVTSDSDEGYFNQLILNDEFLRINKGLPLIFDCFHIPEWNAYVILRENVKYGLDKLPESSPLARSIHVLDDFGERAMRVEQKVAKLLDSLYGINDQRIRSNFAYAYREAKGMIRSEIIKALKKLPQSKNSQKYGPAMSVVSHSLDKYGIALWDLHTENLGRHQFDMREFNKDAPKLDTECILILDVGGNFGSPIMADDIIELTL